MSGKYSPELKEIRLTFNISDHDLATRARQAEKFLARGDRIRVNLRLRGREKALAEHAKGRVAKLLEMINLTIPTKIEKPLAAEPRGFAMIVTKK